MSGTLWKVGRVGATLWPPRPTAQAIVRCDSAQLPPDLPPRNSGIERTKKSRGNYRTSPSRIPRDCFSLSQFRNERFTLHRYLLTRAFCLQMPPFGAPRARTMANGVLAHRSVEEPILGRRNYRPANLPANRCTVDDAACVDDIRPGVSREK